VSDRDRLRQDRPRPGWEVSAIVYAGPRRTLTTAGKRYIRHIFQAKGRGVGGKAVAGGFSGRITIGKVGRGRITEGVDLWLEHATVSAEASGTRWMKAGAVMGCLVLEHSGWLWWKSHIEGSDRVASIGESRLSAVFIGRRRRGAEVQSVYGKLEKRYLADVFIKEATPVIWGDGKHAIAINGCFLIRSGWGSSFM